MRRFILLCIVIISMAGSLAAEPMVLTPGGELYKVWVSPDEGLVLSHVAAGAEDTESLIPQSMNINLDTVSVLVDEKSSSVFVLFEDSVSDIRLAVFNAGTWIGPLSLNGTGSFINTNPRMMLDEAVTEIPAEDPEEPAAILKTTFLHVVWWQHDDSSGLGHAVYLPLALDEAGIPLVDEARSYDLSSLLPYGVSCSSRLDVDGFAYPQFLRDHNGQPLLFTTDFSSCVFHFLRITYELSEEGDSNDPQVNPESRRRQIAVFRTGDRIMVIPPDVVLDQAKLLLGSDYSVLIYWDGDHGVNWIRSDSENWWSERKTLTTGEQLSHEQAVELIRNLVY